jgi:hypothetical protein
MAQSVQPGRFGHSGKPDDAWLAKQEQAPILEPALPIIEKHQMGPGLRRDGSGSSEPIPRCPKLR